MNYVKPTMQPTGEIVREWVEFGQTFKVEKLIEPRLVGSGLRPYRLWHNDYPATGGQWHYDIEGALRRAEYVLRGTYLGRIEFLERRVSEVERELRKVQNG